jgi:hypothetical protein
MMKFKLTGLAAICAAAVASLGLSASTVTARTDGDPLAAPLPPTLMAAAAAFDRYTRGATAIDPASFASGPSVAKALTAGAAYEPRQFEAGMVAYAALAALRDADFVDAVRQAGGEDFVARLQADPYAVLQLPGAVRAAGLAASALAARGGPLAEAGRQVKQSAYTVQHSAWSKATVAEPAVRLARVKAISARPFAPEDTDIARLLQSGEGSLQRAALVSGAIPTPIVVRALALAALSVLGRAADDPASLSVITDEPQQASCLKMAKLNLYQCLAVAGPHYEDIFCLGQHAMIDTGTCILKAAGAPAGGGSIQTSLH